MTITTCLLVLLNQSRDNACELVSSLSAYESCLVYLEKFLFLHDFHGPTDETVGFFVPHINCKVHFFQNFKHPSPVSEKSQFMNLCGP